MRGGWMTERTPANKANPNRPVQGRHAASSRLALAIGCGAPVAAGFGVYRTAPPAAAITAGRIVLFGDSNTDTASARRAEVFLRIARGRAAGSPEDRAAGVAMTPA
jgi:hypothetical protein